MEKFYNVSAHARDFTRGVIMALMAWDHVAGFWYSQHYGSEGLGGLFLYLNADLVPFMARFITHFCAPTFFFLSGTSIAISTVRKLQKGVSQRKVSLHLVKRAVVLVLLMVFIEVPSGSARSTSESSDASPPAS